jgi:FAD-dependent oxidoreductase domain-containing protein 1
VITAELSSSRFDAIIVGGGVMGSSVAYHLLTIDPDLRVVVVEKDRTFAQASSALSVGNARVQFSLAQNIQISKYTLEFIGHFSDEMEVDGERPDLSFKPEGNLFLVDEGSEEAAREALNLQQRMGCAVDWWSIAEIEDRLPLLSVGDHCGGTFGSLDGHLDGYAFLMGFRRKAASMGAILEDGQVMALSQGSGAVTGVLLSDGRRVSAPVVVNCAGAWAAQLLESVGVSLPVVPVQRQVFVVEPEVKPPAPLPLVSLPSGLYFRSEGEDRILVGRSFPEDAMGFRLRWEESRFNDLLWPDLVGMVPGFDRLRFERGWAGLYAVNTLDGNAILGEWPELQGLYLANGFSGHGLQQAPAVGRYLAELILERKPVLDLSVFSPERILEGRAIEEAALV